jgi:hypothetical protein
MKKNEFIVETRNPDLKLHLKFDNLALYELDKALGVSLMSMMSGGRDDVKKTLLRVDVVVEAILAGLSWNEELRAGMDAEKVCHLINLSKIVEYGTGIMTAIMSTYGLSVKEVSASEKDPPQGAAEQEASNGVGESSGEAQ